MSIINAKYINLENKKEEFFNALPFPHIVLDDFLSAEFFSQLKNSFDEVGSVCDGKNFNSEVEEKKWISLNSSLPSYVKQVVDIFQSNDWINNMKILTGISSLVGTANGNTMLANYHTMSPGGILGPHVDHSSEPILNIPHVLNVIVHLTENWNEEDGGGTLLYDQNGEKVIVKVPFKQNRAIIFLHTPYSFHGVERIRKEAKYKRKTIYVDYYSESYKPYSEMNLNFDSSWFRHGTTFKLNHFVDYLSFKNKGYAKTLLEYHFNRLKAKWT